MGKLYNKGKRFWGIGGREKSKGPPPIRALTSAEVADIQGNVGERSNSELTASGVRRRRPRTLLDSGTDGGYRLGG